MNKYIFVDTNIFLECKSFTEINWKEVFKNIQGEDKIEIIVPYMVNEELDNLKNKDKKARNIQKFFRKTNKKEFKEGIALNISPFPIIWNTLRQEWREKLDENKPDCKIIAEILVFKDKNPNSEIIFVTGDNAPYVLADALGINTINTFDDEYEVLFKPIKKQTVSEKKLTDLIVQFINNENENNISIETNLNWEQFISEEFPDFLDIKNDKEKEKLNSEQEKNKDISYDMTVKEAKEKGLTIGNLFNAFGLKSRDEIREEIQKYYEDMKEYKKYIEIELILKNRGNKPYNNVNVEICTILEKGFELKAELDHEKPEKPDLERQISFIPKISTISSVLKEYNVTYRSAEKIEKEKNDVWIFGYNIKKIQHNNPIQLYSIMIKFPENYKTKKIYFMCKFTHDEEGTTKDHKLRLNIIK